MDPIFIKVFSKDAWTKKNIMDATKEERLIWYYKQSKGQIANVLERFIVANLKDIPK